MTGLRPFFTYFGGKWRAAPKYPPPIYDTIIEPFAGSAGYSLRYPDRKIILVEKSEAIAGIWRYLVGASEREILALPLLEPGQSVEALDVCQEARWLIGMWVSSAPQCPKQSRSANARRSPEEWAQFAGSPRPLFWGPLCRSRIASQLGRIRHWQITCGDYSGAPDERASWFVDPPYELQGVHYPCGSNALDYDALADWCRTRRGQVMVCEAQGSAWLPFSDWGSFRSNNAATGRKRHAEALWMNDWPGAALWLPAKGEP